MGLTSVDLMGLPLILEAPINFNRALSVKLINTNSILESILPIFVFIHFPIFAVKLAHFVT